MKVILLKQIPKLGKFGEEVEVRSGFGRNYLIPNEMAVLKTPENQKQFEVRRVELEKAAQLRLQEATARASALEGLSVTVAACCGEEGRLFGSVGAHEIAQAVIERGHTIAKSEVRLITGPIRQIGEYEIELQLGEGVAAKLLISVIPT